MYPRYTGDDFRALFNQLRSLEGSYNAFSVVRKVPAVHFGQTIYECVALPPAAFMVQAYAHSSSGYIEKARVYMLYKTIYDALVVDGFSEDYAMNLASRYFQTLRKLNRTDALRILDDANKKGDIQLTRFVQETILREVRDTPRLPPMYRTRSPRKKCDQSRSPQTSEKAETKHEQPENVKDSVSPLAEGWSTWTPLTVDTAGVTKWHGESLIVRNTFIDVQSGTSQKKRYSSCPP